jgi:hypothetical protein
MIHHFCVHTYATLDRVRQEIGWLEQSKVQFLSQAEKERIDTTTISVLDGEAQRLGFMEIAPTLMFNILSLSQRLRDGDKLAPQAVRELLNSIWQGFYLTLSDLRFAYIPPPNSKYFEQDELFGAKVYNRLPSARVDIKDAGNCYAGSLYTACVFHLMRVAEHGLRAIADKLGVEVSDKKQPIPLEYGDWNKVIGAISNEIKKARTLPNNTAKEELLKRYSEGNDRILRARDIWRNNVSHTRTVFSESEARDALDRIKELMQFVGETLEMDQ